MNKPLFNKVHALAEKLMDAAQREDADAFYQQYDELETLCIEHDGTKKDHPVLWETLADFTEDFEDALEIYEKALSLANDLKTFDYQASIQFSMAQLLSELNKSDSAKSRAQQAMELATKIDDNELVQEIQEWLDGFQYYQD